MQEFYSVTSHHNSEHKTNIFSGKKNIQMLTNNSLLPFCLCLFLNHFLFLLGNQQFCLLPLPVDNKLKQNRRVLSFPAVYTYMDMHLIELGARHRSQNVLSKKSLKSILEDNMRQVHCVIVNYWGYQGF